MRWSSSAARAAVLAGLAAGVLGGPPASANVQVIGKSLAASCSTAAVAGRADLQALDICSMSLAEELLPLPDRAATFVNRAILHIRRRSFDAAMLDLQSAAGLAPDLGEVYANRGAVLAAQGRMEPALNDFNHALELGLSRPERTYYNRAIAREALNDVKGAYQDYRRAAELDPEWAEPRLELVRFTVTSR